MAHPAFNLPLATVSVLVALIGIAIAYAFYDGRLKSWPKGSRERNSLAHAGKTFLVNKYYLDVLYTNIIVGSIKGPIAQRRLLVQPARHRQRA